MQQFIKNGRQHIRYSAREAQTFVRHWPGSHATGPITITLDDHGNVTNMVGGNSINQPGRHALALDAKAAAGHY